MDKLPSVCILTVGWNQIDKTLACLQTVEELAYDRDRFGVLVIDNGSSDDTTAQIEDQFPQVKVITLPQNLGFSGGYNHGLIHSLEMGYDYTFLINNDTLLDPHCLSHLVDQLEQQPHSYAWATAKIYYAADPLCVWSVGGLYNGWNLEIVGKGDNQPDRGQWDTPRDLDFAPLCGVLLHRRLLESIGLLDTNFFVYYEDMDFFYRAHQAGFYGRLAPDAKMWHVVSASSGGQVTPGERYWMGQGSGYYFRKHARVAQLFIIIPYRLLSLLKLSVKLLMVGKVWALIAYCCGLAVGWATKRATTQPPLWLKRRFR